MANRGHTLVFSLFSPRGNYFIKAGGQSIAHEFHFLSAARKSLNELVPETLSLVPDVNAPNVGVLNVAVYRFIDMKILDRNLDIHTYETVVDALCKIEKYLNETSIFSKKNTQHGDFYYRNMGICNHTPVVFDWEEVGSVADIGFDFSIFISSLLNFEPDRIIYEYIRGKSKIFSALIDRYVEQGGHDREAILWSLPRHLRTFVELKQSKGYGEEIIERVCNCYARLESGISSA
jgi:hypothetical protein